MYTKKVQIMNYGPIGHLDIDLPFDGDAPKPVVLVGENGTGKSILLSHIVNGMAYAKGIAYPETPEVDTGRVFKIRSSSYIKSGREYYFGRVDFEEGLFVGEVAARRLKQDYESMPPDLLETPAKEAWDQMEGHANSHLTTNLDDSEDKIRDIFYKNCVLYFPSNRFEEPSWLNEENLKAKANQMRLTHLTGHTNRRMINYSPLRELQDWLYGVVYDRIAFDIQTTNISINQGNNKPPLIRSAILYYSGTASSLYEVVLNVLRRTFRDDNVRLSVGPRTNRLISLQGRTGLIVPNIFHLSSGETSLLNLIFSILRDFDLCRSSFDTAQSVRGIAVVDEIDLHLHAVHQHEILPELMKMFPRVQFIVTTHSPLFVLGMEKVFGQDGFALYEMPHGDQIDPEEFSEFASAYQTLTATKRFSNDIRSAVKNAQKPLLYVEGTTNCDYLRRAAELLGRTDVLAAVRVLDGEGDGDLKNIWRAVVSLSDDVVPNKVVVLFDCDAQGCAEAKTDRFKLKIPRQTDHPIGKGIENLFDKETLERAQSHKPAFIDIVPEHKPIVRGTLQVVPEKWTVNSDEKRNLCDWLCENGTAEDFRHFELIFDLLDDVLDMDQTEK